MALRHTQEKQTLRFTVVANGVTMWAVRDTLKRELVETEIRDPITARLLAEQLNENPPSEV